MAIDPRAAAAAAQAAADAARAAADAAAAAEAATATARAEAAAAPAPTLATSATREALQDTGVTLGSELGGDAAGLADLGHEESGLADQERGGLASLPDLPAGLGDAGGFELPTLEGSFSSGGGDVSKSSIMDGDANPPLHGIVDGEPWTGGGSTGGGSTGGGSTGGSGGSTGGGGESGDSSGGASGGFEWGKVWEDTKTAAKADYDNSWVSDVVDFFTGDDDTSTSTDTTTEGGSTGGAGTPDAGDIPAEDAPFNPPPGWIGTGDLGGVIRGSRGGDPDADDSSTGKPGPQGGDWAVNPGSEGTMNEAGRNSDLRDASAVTWVGQPAGGDENLPEQMPAELQALEPGPGPEVINPERSAADTADAEAEASTSYQSLAAEVDVMPMSDPDAGLGMPAFAPEDDAAGSAGHGRGREFGQEQGEGRGHGRRDDEAVDLSPE